MGSWLVIAVVFVWAPLLPMRVTLYLLGPLWRRLGDVSIVISLSWFVLLDFFLWRHRDLWIEPGLASFPGGRVIGAFFMAFGITFGLWTIQTLGLSAFLTRPQLSPDKTPSKLIARGPFSIVRHPFYLSEWFILLGALLMTRSMFVLALIVLALAIDPLIAIREEKELVERIGTDYVEYRKRVPRLLPTFKRNRR